MFMQEHVIVLCLGIRQSDAHMKNNELYKKCAQRPLHQLLREQQLKFIGHFHQMDQEEHVNIYALYKSEARQNAVGRDQERRFLTKYQDM